MQSKKNLDQYLRRHGFWLTPDHTIKNEGYTSNNQRNVFAKELKKHSHIKNIVEIGFNAGHSAEFFLENCPLATIISFDLNFHPYTRVGVEYLKLNFPKRFKFIEGNSCQTVIEFAQQEQRKFDLIFIDGGHAREICLQDIRNCALFATQQTLLWIDDSNLEGVLQAINICVEQELIKINQTKSVTDESGLRVWSECRYLFY